GRSGHPAKCIVGGSPQLYWPATGGSAGSADGSNSDPEPNRRQQSLPGAPMMANMRSIHRAVRHIPLALALALPGASSPAGATDLAANRSELIQSMLPTVVNITVRKEVARLPGSGAATTSTGSDETKSYVGSGFVIDPSGLIVTNYHVVEDAFEIAV